MNDNAMAQIMNQLPTGTWSHVTNWPFISCCVCIAIIILTFKRAFSQIWAKAYARGPSHGVFTLMYLVLGLIAAIPSTYLMGVTYFQRAILGVIASGLSLGVYHAAIKRLAQAIGVKDNFLTDPDDDTPAQPAKEEVKEVVVKKEEVVATETKPTT